MIGPTDDLVGKMPLRNYVHGKSNAVFKLVYGPTLMDYYLKKK